MSFRKPFRWIAAACAAIVLSTGTPASAGSEGLAGVWFGNLTADTQFKFDLWSYINNADNPLGYDTNVSAYLYLGRNAVVSATDCKIVLWAELDKANSNPWLSPKVTQSCMDVIRNRSQWLPYYTTLWDTSATQSRSHMCVYLYHGGSSTAGWSRCETGYWAYPDA